jgi:hypothetical protein
VNDRTRHRRVLQIESLEDRVAPSGGPGTALLPIPTGNGRGGAELRILQDRGAQRLQNIARRRLDAGFAGFNRALTNLDRALDRLETTAPRGQDSALRGFNRAFAVVLRSQTQLNQAFVTSPTVLQEANRARLQRALDDLGRLDDRIEQILERPSTSALAGGALTDESGSLA